MKSKRVHVITMVISASLLLASCGSTITQADLDAAYQQGYNDGHTASDVMSHQNQESDINSDSNDVIDSITQEETGDNAESISAHTGNTSQQTSNVDNENTSVVQTMPDTQISDSIEEMIAPVPDIVSVIAAMQASAPVIDTSDIILNEGTDFESDAIFMPGTHIGVYNGVQVDDMLSLSSRAYQEKYYVVTDDLKNVENTFRNGYEKTWLELGYTNCIPAIRYDSRNNKYEENPYDMVHPGWQHTYAVLYICTWSDGTPRCGVYYIKVSNNTDQEVMAILCPITQISDGLNIIF